MNRKKTGIIILLIIAGFISGCDIKFDRAEVEKSIYINQPSLSLFIGESKKLTASPSSVIFNWRSEDTQVATVNSSGLVEAVGVGSTNIVASYDNVETKIEVIVTEMQPLIDIIFSNSAFEFEVGDEATISAMPKPLDANNYDRFYWSSDNEKVVKVSPSGKVTAIASGNANITVRAGNIIKTIPVGIYRNVNIAYKKPITVSSTLNANSPGENAVDGVIANTSRWLSEGGDGPHWIIVDFEGEYKIHEFSFYGDTYNRIADFKLQKEENGEWIDIFSVSGNSKFTYIRSFEDTMASKVRFYITKATGDGIVRLRELEIMAKLYE